MSVVRYAVIALAIAAILWPASPPLSHASLAGSQWRILEVGGAPASGAGTLRFTQTSVRGRGACNRFFGSFREHEGRIEIAGLFAAAAAEGRRSTAADEIPCNGSWSLERYVLEMLGRASSYRIDDGMLVLIDDGGRPLARLGA